LNQARHSNSMPRAMRLTRRAQYDGVFDARKSAGDRLLTVYAAPNDLPHPRLGILAGKSVGKAVARNRAKRLIREAFRLSREDKPPHFDFVVIARKSTCNATFDAVQSSFVRLSAEARAKWQR
jgi:ribonuclease P protein component